MREEIQDTKEIKMDPITLAQEIIDGRRITREDDLSFFLTCDLDELCKGADMIEGEVYRRQGRFVLDNKRKKRKMPRGL